MDLLVPKVISLILKLGAMMVLIKGLDRLNHAKLEKAHLCPKLMPFYSGYSVDERQWYEQPGTEPVAFSSSA